MFARLAFSVAINVEPEVLIVDEALSVGDMNFQAKCMKKFKDLQNQGTTILLVSHDIGAILQFSSKVIFIANGSVQYDGDPKIAIDQYKKVLLDDIKVESNNDIDERLITLANGTWCKELELSKVHEVYGNGKVEITDIAVLNKDGKITQKLFANEVCIFKMKINLLV